LLALVRGLGLPDFKQLDHWIDQGGTARLTAI